MIKRILPVPVLVTLVTIPLGLLLLLLTPTPAQADCGTDASSCKVCHEGNQELPVNQSGAWHVDHAFGDFCASCHAGDKGSSDKAVAHTDMRPVLADAKVSCESCHADNYVALAESYTKPEAKEKDSAAAPVVAPQLPPPGSNNGLFIGLNLAAFLGLILLVWAWEKGPLARFTVKRTPPMAGGQEPASRNPFALKAWSPYIAGAGLGLVGILALWLSQQPLGSSGAFMIGASSLARWIGLSDLLYFKVITPPALTWQVLLVFGIPVGAFLSAWFSKDFRFETAPDRWVKIFGGARWKRWLAMFVGGAILEFGASIAGGCTSGLAIAGTMQLAGAGFLFIAGLFTTGMITAKLLYGRNY